MSSSYEQSVTSSSKIPPSSSPAVVVLSEQHWVRHRAAAHNHYNNQNNNNTHHNNIMNNKSSSAPSLQAHHESSRKINDSSDEISAAAAEDEYKVPVTTDHNDGDTDDTHHHMDHFDVTLRRRDTDIDGRRTDDDNNEREEPGSLARHLSFWDLLAIGVCGSIGSGIFVLVGLVAHDHAGRASPLSWMAAGLAAATSSLCFAELAAHIPDSGSTYVYTRICWGSTLAVVSASCLTLEYGVSGAAVARTWGDKVVVYLTTELLNSSNDNDDSTASTTLQAWLLPFDGAIHVPAALVSAASTWLLVKGVKESKQVTNIFTIIKMALVSFMILGGLTLYRAPGMNPTTGRPQIPFAPHGAAGVLRGATSSFFGFLGYDEVCVVAGEALHPQRDLPRAVLGTVVIVTLVSVLAAFALSNMGIPYTEISPASGFPQAFSDRGWTFAAHFTSIGELVSLPIVVLVSLMAQPRLTLAMAQDGILPASIFGTAHRHSSGHGNHQQQNGSGVDSSNGCVNDGAPSSQEIAAVSPDEFNSEHNLTGGTLFAGVAMTIIAALVPFNYLDDLISSGILVAFCMANSSLILLRCEPRHYVVSSSSSPSSSLDFRQAKQRLDVYLLVYNFLCFVTSILWTRTWDWMPGGQKLWATLSLLTWLACLLSLAHEYPASAYFGKTLIPAYRRARNGQRQGHNDDDDDYYSDYGNGENNNYAATTNMTPGEAPFRAPCVPYLPCFGMAINWYLVAQLEFFGLVLLALYLGMTVFAYHVFCCGSSTRTHHPSGSSGQNYRIMMIGQYLRRAFFFCWWWRQDHPYETVASPHAPAETATMLRSVGNGAGDSVYSNGAEKHSGAIG